MDAVIRPLADSDRPAVSRLLDDAVGEGFWSFGDAAPALSYVALRDGKTAGVVLTRLAPPDDPDMLTALESSAAAIEQGNHVLYVRAVAVAPDARRAGLARRLLARAETEASARGARPAFLYAWLPAGRPEPFAVLFYESAGYAAGPDIAGFYAAGSVATGAVCPYCGEPPCRCAARPFVKPLTPA